MTVKFQLECSSLSQKFTDLTKEPSEYRKRVLHFLQIEGCIADAAGKREESRGVDDEKLMALAIIWDQLVFASKFLKKYMAEVKEECLLFEIMKFPNLESFIFYHVRNKQKEYRYNTDQILNNLSFPYTLLIVNCSILFNNQEFLF